MAAYTFAFAAIGLIALLGQTSGLPCATCPGGQWTAPPAYQPHVPAPVQQQWQPRNPGLLPALLVMIPSCHRPLKVKEASLVEIISETGYCLTDNTTSRLQVGYGRTSILQKSC
ncbi:unnamed protein product [Plutella xylostella]|uniref:(diamondback moth) hypothetical protein n=1 Tax=Plutella xylostella TaxID=51655 RepID=A0A8S4FRI3_PLUXY|nr:unnamed protein product [Plutella xylostella]